MRKNTNALCSCISIGSCLVIAYLALWHAPSAQAQLLVYEGYDYDADTTFPNPTDGSLNGGIGWAGGWTTQQFLDGDPNPLPNPSQAIVDGLNYTDSKGNRLKTSGRAHDMYGEWWATDIGNPLRDFDTASFDPNLLTPAGSLGKYGTTLWVSILLEGRDETTGSQASFYQFSDANLQGANRNLHIGRPSGLKLDGTGVYNGGDNEAYGIMRKKDNLIRSNPGDVTELFAGSGVDAGSGAGNAEKVFMVLKLDFNGTFDEIAEVEFNLAPGDYGTNVSAWINPDLDAEPQVGVGSFADEVNFWEVTMSRIHVHGNANLIFDEFRIGTTYADVAPIDTSTGLDGDFDLDLDVDGADFLDWQRNLGDATNLALWEGSFGAPGSLAAVGAVPEPTTMMLVGLTLAGFAVRRRR